MEIEIDIDTIKKTIHCRNDFDCLKNQNHIFKKVESFVNLRVLFIDCDDRCCNYNRSFGNSTVCNCPTRRAIYKKYAK